jgi:hypothetical protein
MSRPLIAALGASIAIVLGAPYIGQLRGLLQSALPGQYRLIIGGIVALSVCVAFTAAVVRIREQRLLRYVALGGSLTIAVAYIRLTATGDVDVDLVEGFHFVEYGVLTLLFYRVWHGHHLATALSCPVMAAALVGVLDEWLQWFVPIRVGELRDIALNGAAVASGLLFSVAVIPPVGRARAARSRVPAAGLAAALVIVYTAFFQSVHVGFEIHTHEDITFRSLFRQAALEAAARDRAERWRDAPPVTFARLSQDDKYLEEGLWHIRRRNEAAATGDLGTAWSENRILEEFFAPVLDFPSYAAPLSSRWAPEHHAQVEAALEAAPLRYVSDAPPLPIYTWNRAIVWSAVAVVTAMLALWAVWPRLRPGTSRRPGVRS